VQPEYFITNIGNTLLSHYERLTLLCYIEKHEAKTIKDSDCINALRSMLHLHSKYITEIKTGLIWKKISYAISPEGNAFLSICRHKTKHTFQTLKQYIQTVEDNAIVMDDIIEKVDTIARKDFKSFADFMIQRDILRGILKHLFVYKSLNTFNSICNKYGDGLFFMLAKEICGDGVDRFLSQIKADEEETSVSREIPINFS